MSSSTRRAQTPQKATACVHCRQMKLRCDRLADSLDPCTRCARRKIPCHVDPAFRRTAKRDRLDEMEKELQNMKRMIGPHTRGPIYDVASGTSSIPVASPSEVAAASGPSALPEKATLLYLDVLLSEKSLEGVSIDAYLIKNLLDNYYQNCHPLFPILPPLETFILSYDSCSVLFWAVMVVSTKCLSMHSKLHTQLIEPVRRLASEFTKIENRCVEFVQALLLLCSWPFPFNVSITDTSWMFCGMATHMALQLGLHRPHHQTEFVYRPQQQPEFGPNSTPNEMESSIRRSVWVGCYIVNHSVSGMIGVPATITCDHAILEAMGGSSASIPATIYHQLQIANVKDRVSRLLGQNNQSSSGLQPDPTPFIRILNEELDMLASQQEANWEPEIKITFICARLRLYSFAFLQDIIEEPDAGLTRDSARTEFCLSAYLAAMGLTTIASSRSPKAMFWTAEIWTCIVYATMFLLRLWERSKIYGLDETSIRSAVTQLRGLIAENSKEYDDHLARVCAIIDYLSKDGCADIPLRRPLKFHSRLSSNLVLDTVWHAKERFNLAKGNQPPNDDMSMLDVENWMLSYFEEEQGFPMAEGLGWDMQ
ncbi:hypothetical protein VE03_01510 [Pseudogymnoascus sp. 23342-1-I1]|nr:hypothetical protein VE03_01510 [Pseudogymnoascus sp. 23342-1-I1]